METDLHVTYSVGQRLRKYVLLKELSEVLICSPYDFVVRVNLDQNVWEIPVVEESTAFFKHLALRV